MFTGFPGFAGKVLRTSAPQVEPLADRPVPDVETGPAVRVDSHLFSGYTIPPHYDSMIAKLIVHRATREEAIDAMQRALSEYVIDGVKTTIPIFQRILRHADFQSGQIDTGFIDQFLG